LSATGAEGAEGIWLIQEFTVPEVEVPVLDAGNLQLRDINRL